MFAGAIAAEHAADLGDGDVAFVDDDEEIVGKIVDEAGRCFAGCASGEVARVIFDARAIAERSNVGDILICALFDALAFDEFVGLAEEIDAFLEFGFDRHQGFLAHFVGDDVVAGWENRELVDIGIDAAAQRIDFLDAFDRHQVPRPLFIM